MRSAARSPRKAVSSHRSCCYLALLVIASAGGIPAALSARDLAPIDALADSPAGKGNSAAPVGQGALAAFHGHIDERLGIPTFLFSAPGVVRQRPALKPGQDAEAIARGHLKSLATSYQISVAEIDALPVTGRQQLPNGAAIVQFGNAVDGIEVFRERAGVLVNADGSLGSIGGYVSGAAMFPQGSGKTQFKLNAQDAVALALQDFDFTAVAVRGALRSTLIRDGYESFALGEPAVSGAILAQPARSKPVLFRTPAGLEPGWYLEIHVATPATAEDSFYSYVVSARDGRLLFRHNLTVDAAFAYRVWAETTPPYLPYPGPTRRQAYPHPTATPNGYQPLPFSPDLITLGNALPPTSVAANDPWLPPGATSTAGNNVDAYADLAYPDGFTGGDLRASITSLGAFDRSYSLTDFPNYSQNQQMAAVTELFYLNNWLHDWYYDAGFDEAAGNAQADNFGRGGIAGDPLHAEAQDFSGRDNANMMTPADGSSPRMQMYVFDGSKLAVVNNTGNIVQDVSSTPAAFGPTTFDSGALATMYADDGTGTVHDGCEPFINAASVAGKIAVVDRGTCSFKLKAVNAQNALAAGLVVVNNAPGAFNASGVLGDDNTVTTTVVIPVLGIDQAKGNALETALSGGVNTRMRRINDVDRDGDLDNTVVAHEWGHFISNRLVHNAVGLTTNMAEGMGEGFGDFHALLMTVKAEDALTAAGANFAGVYSVAGWDLGGTSIPGALNNSYYFGLRRYPYSTDMTKNPLTFKHVQDGVALPVGPAVADYGAPNSEVHNTGEVWGSMLWECYASLLRDTPRLTFSQAQDRMKRYLVAGYKLMPFAPTFTEARDAILSVVLSQDSDDFHACATGFAKRGLGAGAVSPDRYSSNNVAVVESFTGSAIVLGTVAATVDDSINTCDADGELDAKETGTVTLTLRNDGFLPAYPSVTGVSSPDSFVHVLQSTPPPAIAPFESAQWPVKVQLDDVSDIRTFSLQYMIDDPSLVFDAHKDYRINVDNVASQTDDFENSTLAWTPVLQGPTDVADQWSRREIDATHHVVFGPDRAVAGLSMLVSPAMQVSASGSFVVAFKHHYEFLTSGQAPSLNYVNGGVIQVSQDNGATWADVTQSGGNLVPAYNGAITTGTPNPLPGAAAFVGISTPGLTSASIDFGSTLKGKTVRIRFVVATSSFGVDAGGGWRIDDFSATGISNKPFTSMVADPGHCLTRIFTNEFEVPVLPHQDYDPAHCDAVAHTLDIFWEEVDGAIPACVGIEHTDGSLADAADGSFSMNGVSASNVCLAPAKYSFALSPDKETLSGSDTLNNVPMTLTLSADGACFVGHWTSGPDDFVATIWNFAQ